MFLFIFVCLFIFSANAELKFRPEFENKKIYFQGKVTDYTLNDFTFFGDSREPFYGSETMIIPPLQMSGSDFTLSCPTFENGSAWFLTIFYDVWRAVV